MSVISKIINPRNVALTLALGSLGLSAVTYRNSRARDSEHAARVQTLQMLEGRKHYVCNSRFGEAATGAAAVAKKGCEEGYDIAIKNAKSAFHAWW